VKLDDRQIELYSRQIILRELGGIGQRRLLDGRCALIGGGPAIDAAAAYLAGAGVGALDLLPDAGGERLDAPAALAFPPASTRTGETSVRVVPAGPRLDLSAYDAALASLSAVAAPERLVGMPRLGAVTIAVSSGATVDLLIAPAGAPGCLGCLRVQDADDDSSAAADAADPTGGAASVAAAQAGALAALAVLRWLAELARDAEARAMRLEPAAPGWVEVRVERTPGCPNGCPAKA
jgi:adenylyltransferase/sulfurtransferase